MKVIVNILIILLCSTLQANFITLQDAQNYAAAYPENPKPDTDDYLNPVYRSTYRKHAPRLWKRVLKKVGLYRKPIFSSQKFKQLLIKTAAARENRGFKDRFVSGLMVEPTTEFVVFADIYGAFHSFVRDLTELKRMGYIDEQLRIIKPNCYFIFMGTNANRSPYVLETLDLLLSFCEKNLDNAIMARSRFMDKGYWSYFGMGSQLKEFAYMASEEKIPLEDEVGNYFNTIGLAFYVVTPATHESVGRFSSYGRDNTELKENLFGSFFELLQPGKISIWDTKNKEKTPKKVHVEELFRVPERSLVYSPSQGLNKAEDEGGAEVWNSFSGPSLINQKLHDFHYDAFAILTLGENVRGSVFTLYNRDIYKKMSFKMAFKVKLIDLMKNNFLVGCSLDLSSGVSGAAKPVNRGMALAATQINKDGGIHGKNLEIYAMDDKYNPALALQNYNTMYDEYGIRIFITPNSSGPVLTLLDRMKKGEVFVAFPIAGTGELRKPDVKGVVNLRASNEEEVIALITYMIEQMKIKKFGFLYQNDAYGIGSLEISRKILKEHGFTDWIEVPYGRGSNDFSKQVRIIRNSGIEALGLFSTAAQAREFISQIDISSLTGMKLFALSYVMENNFREFLKRTGLPVVSSQSIPDPDHSQMEIVKEYRDVMNQTKIPYSVFSLEGYIATRLFGDIANKIEAPVTVDKLIDYMPTIKDYDWKGLKLNFNPQTRQLTHNMWIDLGDGTPWIDAQYFLKKDEKHTISQTDVPYASSVSLVPIRRAANDNSIQSQSVEMLENNMDGAKPEPVDKVHTSVIESKMAVEEEKGTEPDMMAAVA